jgi:signal transduction histidine kinase
MDEAAPLPRLSGPIPEPVVDVLVTAGAFGLSLLLLSPSVASLASSGSGRVDGPAVLLVAAGALPLLRWRRAPTLVLVLSIAASSLLAALGYAVSLSVGPAVALYLLVSGRTAARPWGRATTAVVLGGLAVFVGATFLGGHRAPVLEVLHTVLAWAVAWFAGERTRLGRERLAELHRRAERVERDAERERRLAVAEERARLARDLHDSAGHAINVIAVRAGAARLRHGQEPGRSLAALETIEAIARDTAAEIDQIVGVLRDPTAAGRTPHGLASLDSLVSQHAAGGLDVTLATTGRPRPLTPMVDQAAYRILQEALTNASRHGDGPVRVEVAYAPRSVGLTVINGVRPGTPGGEPGGHGLIGMRERATLVGGTLATERVNGSFRLRADLRDDGGPP